MSERRGQVSAGPTRHIGPEAFGRTEGTALWWLTNAGFLINARGTALMIDPAIAMDPGQPGTSELGMRLLVSLPVEASAVPRLDAVLYTHADEDHCASGTARELVRSGAVFVGPPPVAERLPGLGVPEDRIQVARWGEGFRVGAVEVIPTPADHPWQLRDPEKLGPPWKPGDCCGYLMKTPEGTIWHPGDTRLTDEHVQMRDVDVLLLDVSPNEYHLGVENAAWLANILDVPCIIPHHYGTYDAPEHAAYNGDPAEVEAKISDAEDRFRVLAPGERFEVGRGE